MKVISEELFLIRKKYDITQRKIIALQEELKYGMIDFAEATKQVAELTNQEKKLIKQAVDAVHVKKDGSPRSIKVNESKGLYYTNMPDKKQVYGKTLGALYLNVFNAYGLPLTTKTNTVDAVFKLAFERKQQNSTNKENSFKRNLNTYKTYFTSDFTKLDITKITKDDLLAYTKRMCQTLHPTKKEFLAYKGILNLIFEYAFDKDIRKDNPVPCIHNEDYFKDGFCNCITRESEDNIFSTAQIEEVCNAIRNRLGSYKYKGYDPNGFGIILSTHIGTRVGEICSLKWSDVKECFIWIHFKW